MAKCDKMWPTGDLRRPGGVCPALRGEPPRRPRWDRSRLVSRSCWASWPLLAPIFSMFLFRSFFESILGRFWIPKPSQNRPQIDQKSIPKCTSILTPFFDRFLIDFRSQTGAPEPQKWCFRLRNRYFRSKTVFFNMIPFWDRFWSQLGSILVPKRTQKRSQKRSKKRSKF